MPDKKWKYRNRGTERRGEPGDTSLSEGRHAELADLELLLHLLLQHLLRVRHDLGRKRVRGVRSEEHTSELQSRGHLVCRLLLEKKNKQPSDLSYVKKKKQKKRKR